MTANTYWPKYYYYIGGVSSLNNSRPVLEERVVDFAVVGNPVDYDGDTAINCIPVPANTLIMTAGYQTITTVAGATATFAIATASGTNVFCAQTSAVAAGSYGARPTISATNTNVLVSANADIQINNFGTADLTAGQIKVFALLLYFQMIPSYVDADGNTKTYTYVDRAAWVTAAPAIP